MRSRTSRGNARKVMMLGSLAMMQRIGAQNIVSHMVIDEVTRISAPTTFSVLGAK